MAGPEKIQGLPQPLPPLSHPKTAGSRQPTSDYLSGTRAPTDPVELSPENTEYQHLLKRINQTPDVRTDRLGRIRQALEAGTYQIDSEAVAERLLKESLTNSLTTNQPPDSTPESTLP